LGRFRPDRRASDLVGRVPGVALTAALVVGCGSGQATPTLSGGVASVMSAHLKNVAAAAGRQDPAGATREIDAFAADVAQQDAAGHLSKSDYAALETGIARTRGRIGVEVVAPTPSTPTPVSVAPSPPVAQTVVQSPVGSGNAKIRGDGKGRGDAKAKGPGKVKGDKGGKGKGG
jgi:hypothetical protein